MKNEKKKARQYLIDLQRDRSVIALAACIVTLVFAVGAITRGVVTYTCNGEGLGHLFRFFTTLSNIMTALAASFIIPYAVSGIDRKRLVYPRWIAMLHYSGTVNTTITMLFSMTFILTVNPAAAIGGHNFYLHVICPIAVLVSFLMVESSRELSRKDVICCLVPFFLYSMVYVLMVVILGVWEDFYMFNTLMPFYFSLPAMWILGCLIAFAVRKVSAVLSAKRRDAMLRGFRRDMEPIEIKIEVFGLGRHNGMAGDINDLNIPYDILRMLSERFGLDVTNLAEVYVRGLLDGAAEKEEYLRNK
ncbi:MAG: hypothetical protein K5911_00735 [Eubacteriales bacterium]|nr:hypothetical protein [Eubacteriales bacterium]